MVQMHVNLHFYELYNFIHYSAIRREIVSNDPSDCDRYYIICILYIYICI
jgi:hypothetical protein